MTQDNKLATELQKFRFDFRMSQLEFSRLADVTQSTVSTFEKHGVASDAAIGKIRDAMRKHRSAARK